MKEEDDKHAGAGKEKGRPKKRLTYNVREDMKEYNMTRRDGRKSKCVAHEDTITTRRRPACEKKKICVISSSCILTKTAFIHNNKKL